MTRYLLMLALSASLATYCRAQETPATTDVVVESALVRLIEEIAVPARAAGLLASLDVAEGETVEVGAALAQIDQQEAELLYQRAQVELEISKDKANADAPLRMAKEKLAFSQRKLDRLQQAHKRIPESVTASELDEEQFNVTQAKLEIEQAEEDVRQNHLQVELKQSELEVSQHNVDLRKIVAPVTGVVVEVMRHRGEWVEPGDKVLRVLRMDRLRVEGLVPVGLLPAKLDGARVSVIATLPAQREVRCEGVITFVSPEVNPVNGQVRVWAEVDNHDRMLRPGLRATMTIHP